MGDLQGSRSSAVRGISPRTKHSKATSKRPAGSPATGSGLKCAHVREASRGSPALDDVQHGSLQVKREHLALLPYQGATGTVTRPGHIGDFGSPARRPRQEAPLTESMPASLPLSRPGSTSATIER